MSEKKRATLAEHDGLSFRSVERMAHACDLAFWRERGWITNDLDAGCSRLTAEGRERIKLCCGTCRAWRPIPSRNNLGQCWSADRTDDADHHAGITCEYETCEAWLPQVSQFKLSRGEG